MLEWESAHLKAQVDGTKPASAIKTWASVDRKAVFRKESNVLEMMFPRRTSIHSDAYHAPAHPIVAYGAMSETFLLAIPLLPPSSDVGFNSLNMQQEGQPSTCPQQDLLKR
eukprot:6467374-Amphidinium_carterae.1